MTIKVNDIEFNKLPCMIYQNESLDLEHTVIMIHGFNNDKYECSKIALKLARLGYQVVCFDMEGHGDRKNDLMKGIESDVDYGNLLFRLIEQTSNEVIGLHPHIKNKTKSIIGLSMGANVVNHLLSKPLDYHNRVSVLGALSFVDLLSYSMEKKDLEDYVSQDEKALLHYVDTLDPSKHMLPTVTGQTLFINASNDDSIPSKYTKAPYDRWLADNDQYTYYEEEEYHYVSNTMVDKIIEFIKTS